MRGALGGLISVALLAGCGGASTTATVGAPATVPAAKKPEKTVVVHESEFKLDPPDVNGGAEGLVKIKVVNDGKLPHSLAVDGPNGEVDMDGQVDPGGTATFEADLDQPGTYTWYCPLDHHREKGMVGTITVGGSSPARGAEPTGTTPTSTTPMPTQTTTETQTETTTVTTPSPTRTQTSTTPTQTSTTPTATTGGSGY